MVLVAEELKMEIVVVLASCVERCAKDADGVANVAAIVVLDDVVDVWQW